MIANTSSPCLRPAGLLKGRDPDESLLKQNAAAATPMAITRLK